MAYRGDDGGAALEAPTAEGPLVAAFEPNRVELSVAERILRVENRIATVTEGTKRQSFEITGRLCVARGYPREDLGVWVELLADHAMRRIFGVEPIAVLDPDGLVALRRLEVLAQRVRATLAALAGTVHRAVEIGDGHVLDKVLLADRGDRFEIYARRLFRGAAEPLMTIHADGRIVILDGKAPREVQVTSRFGVTVRGDYLRFADRHGTDLARVSIPWVGPEDRDELARRIGQLVDLTDRAGSSG